MDVEGKSAPTILGIQEEVLNKMIVDLNIFIESEDFLLLSLPNRPCSLLPQVSA